MKNTTIVYIDDDRDDQDFFSMAIERLATPPQLLTFSNGDIVVDLLHRENNLIPACFFIDLKMPGENGWEIARAIRNIPRLALTPIILYTDYPDYEKNSSQPDKAALSVDIAIVQKKFFSIDSLSAFISTML